MIERNIPNALGFKESEAEKKKRLRYEALTDYVGSTARAALEFSQLAYDIYSDVMSVMEKEAAYAIDKSQSKLWKELGKRVSALRHQLALVEKRYCFIINGDVEDFFYFRTDIRNALINRLSYAAVVATASTDREVLEKKYNVVLSHVDKLLRQLKSGLHENEIDRLEVVKQLAGIEE